MNCTNVTELPPARTNLLKPPQTVPGAPRGIIKRSRPANDGGARSKRLKFTIRESRVDEDEEADSVESDESESSSDGGITLSCATRRKCTVFHAKHSLAMSRPGVTCRPLPRKSSHTVTIAFCH